MNLNVKLGLWLCNIAAGAKRNDKMKWWAAHIRTRAHSHSETQGETYAMSAFDICIKSKLH